MYLRVGVLFLPWMLLNPLVSVSVLALDPWVRDRIVSLFLVGLSYMAYASLAFLLWPSRAEEHFTLAASTSADGLLNTAGAGAQSDEEYRHI